MKCVLFSVLIIAVAVVLSIQLQCKDPNGRPIDWFTVIKLPNLYSNVSDGTVYVYMDAENPEWTVFMDITANKSAIGHTVSQMYAPTDSYNNDNCVRRSTQKAKRLFCVVNNQSIMWLVYNDEPTNDNTTFTFGHTKGIVMADRNSGFWLVHSVPKFPLLPYQNNLYTYPKTGIKFGQSFLCMSMMAQELDNVGNQLINNEALVYGSHFGNDLKEVYPTLYNSTLPLGKPNTENDGVRLQHLQSIKGFKFLSISKNRLFGKDLYDGLITQLIKSNIYTETWLNSLDRFNSSCSSQYKVMNIKSLNMKSVEGLKNCSFKSSKDHSKWMITDKSSVPWTCVGDINRANDQISRGGGTVCIDSIQIWSKFKKLLLEIEGCT